MYFSASAVNAAFDFDLGPTVNTGTSRALDNSFSNNNKHKNTNDLLKMKKDEVSKSNVGEGGEKLNWINAGDKDEDVTAVHLEEGSDVKKFTHEEQTDKDLTRMKSHRGTTLINPVMFFPKALSFVFCLVLSVVAAKNVMPSGAVTDQGLDKHLNHKHSEGLKQGSVLVEDGLNQLQEFASHLRSGIGGGTTETDGSNNPFVEYSDLHETGSFAAVTLNNDGTLQNFFKSGTNFLESTVQTGISTASRATDAVVEVVVHPVGETATYAAHLAQDTSTASLNTVIAVTEDVVNTADSVLNSAEQLAKEALVDVKNTSEDAIFEAEQAANAAEEAANYAEQAVGDTTYEYLEKADQAAAIAQAAAERATMDARKASEDAAKMTEGVAKTAALRAAEAAEIAAEKAAVAAEKAVEAAGEAARRAAETAIAVSKEVKEEFLDKMLLPFVLGAMDFFGLLDEVIAEIFKLITQAIYEFYQLEAYDNLVKDIIAGGRANLHDVLLGTLEGLWNNIKIAIDLLEPFLSVIVEGLEKIGSKEFIDSLMNGNGVSPASPTNSPPTSPTTSSNSPDYIEIGNWRIAHTCETCERSHLTISSDNIETAQIFREDGTLHPGPRSGFNGWDEDSASGPTFSSKGITFGNKAVQIRDWRIRQIDDEHMSVSHKNGNVARIYRSDGTLHGNVKSFSGWKSDIGAPSCAYLTESYLQIGDWRFGKIDGNHFSVTHKDGKTAAIYKTDGTVHSGPRTDFNAWGLSNEDVIMGSNHGCSDNINTAQLFRDHPGPRANFKSPTNSSYLSADEQAMVSTSVGLKSLVSKIEGMDITSILHNHIKEFSDHWAEDFDESFIENVVDDIKTLVEDAHDDFREFLQFVDGLGSIQFLVTYELESVVGMVIEFGLSIDVKQLLYYVVHGFMWDPLTTQLISVHVGYAFDIGVQEGGDVGFSVAYHTSPVTGVNGFGWGLSLEGAFEYAVGLNVAWPIPGTHIPNQYVVQVIGAGAKVEAAGFINHAIIVGYYDTLLGYMHAAPSFKMAEYSGNPSLYYSRYPWKELGVRIFDPTAQDLWGTLGWNEDNWDKGGQPPASSLKDWSHLTSSEQTAARTLGFKESTWNAPSAPEGWAYNHPLEDYFRNHQWSSMLKYEKNLFKCLGWYDTLFDDPTKASDTWFSRWEDLTIEEQLCATAIGYHRARWNSKPRIPTCISSASGTVSDGESCSGNSNCQSGWCESRVYGAPTIGCQGTCKPKRANGRECYGLNGIGGFDFSDPTACVSGICSCDFKCGLSPNGSSCAKNSQCESGWCDGLVTVGCFGTCGDKLENNEVCFTDKSCKSGRCKRKCWTCSWRKPWECGCAWLCDG